MRPFRPFSLNLRNRLVTFSKPAVMGILNVTPDSFYASSRAMTAEALAERIEQLISQGADIIDIGAFSTRPGATDVAVAEEMQRLERGIDAVRKLSADIPISVDTFRAEIARKAVTQWGADIINDISGGDDDMLAVVAETHAPYVMTHSRDITANTVIDPITEELKWFSRQLAQFSLGGATDIIVDPGFGFGKTIDQGFKTLDELERFEVLERPILVGISRKSMISNALNVVTDETLNGTTMLNAIALERGASILRVHDVTQAREVVTLYERFF